MEGNSLLLGENQVYFGVSFMQGPYNAGGSNMPPTPASGGQVNATLLVVMGVLGVACCTFLAPVTWVMSNSALKTLDAGGGNPSDRSTVNIARILGIIGTVILVLSLLWLLFFGGMAAMTGAGRPPIQPGIPPTQPIQ